MLCQTNMKTMYNTREVIPGSVFMSGSLWLNKTCTYAEDCSDQNAICYNTSSTSICLCTPGYFYSNSCNTCVPGKQINHQSLKYVPDRLEYFFNIKVPLKLPHISIIISTGMSTVPSQNVTNATCWTRSWNTKEDVSTDTMT